MNAVTQFVSTSLRRPPSAVADSGVNSEYLVRIAGLEKVYQTKDGNGDTEHPDLIYLEGDDLWSVLRKCEAA